MLSDTGVDVVIFDVTNQLTYPEWYRALLRVWGEMRAAGNRTPQVAFLTPFWDPPKVVRELWRDLYGPGLSNDLWFRWEGKPLILADPDLIDGREEHAKQNTSPEIQPGHTFGQRFTSEKPFRAVGGRFPTYLATNSGVTLRLFREDTTNAPLATRRFTNVADNAWLTLKLATPQPPGNYILEASDPSGKIGWWSHTDDVQPRGQALADGQPVAGDRTLRLVLADDETTRIRDFFTFRKPQPDYFQGPTRPDMWSWLEVHPQHVFRNSRGEKEQMSVGVAQNAVNGRLGSMSEPGAHGRSFHNGATDARSDAMLHGFNVAEQWERALQEDPSFIFVTGWNEWIAGRFAEFNRIKLPVMFVDQFDHEHSRDIEPMKGGHGDNYYYQFAGYVRRYKGARSLLPLKPRPIRIDGKFGDWLKVEPEFRDTVGDPMRREHRGWDAKVTYANQTGRNDFIAAKVSFDNRRVYFHVRTHAPITPPSGTNWMLLFLDTDADAHTGWLGYDCVLNRAGPGSVESCSSLAATLSSPEPAVDGRARLSQAGGAGTKGTPIGSRGCDWARAENLRENDRLSAICIQRAVDTSHPDGAPGQTRPTSKVTGRPGGQGFLWRKAGQAELRVAGDQLELSLPWSALRLKSPPAQLDFKWADNCIAAGDWTDFTLNGDAAPNDRFNYRALLPQSSSQARGE
jgi:hypothetical protein